MVKQTICYFFWKRSWESPRGKAKIDVGSGDARGTLTGREEGNAGDLGLRERIRWVHVVVSGLGVRLQK